MATTSQKTKPTEINSTLAKSNFGQVARRVTIDKEHFIVTRDGYPTVAIIPASEYKELTKKS